nr:hypothetical protein [Tanacetum cinerariifolium]
MTGDDNHDGDHPKTSNPSPPVPTPTQQIPHTVSSIKLSILKKGECDIQAIKMKHYLSHTDYLIWQVIQNGNGPVSVTTDTNGMIKVLPPKTAEEVVARERERKARTTLLMALPEDHLSKFYKMADSQVAWIMRTKPGLDTLSFDDLYNNLRVFERDVKVTTASSSNIQNVAFVSADNTSSTDDLSAPQLDYDDLEQINDDDIEEMDLKWQVAMISMRIKKFHKRTGRKLQFDTKDPDDSKALVTIDGEDIDWFGHAEEDAQNYAMIAYSSSNSGSDNEESDLEDTSVNDKYATRMHTVPPPMTGNYMPFGPDVDIDYSKFTYGPKQTSVDESDSKPSEYASCESDSSVETTTSMPDPIENAPKDDPQRALKDKGIIDSRCSRHMTRNKAYLPDYQEFKGGSVAFGGRRITGKGKIKAGKLDFEDVYYVEELKHYNLFSMLQMYDEKNKVLFTNIDCHVLSLDFKFHDENQVLLKITRQHNMYSFNLKNIDPSGDLACLFAKASIDESNKWHRRLGHVNFKNLNKLVKENLVRVENQANASAGPKEANNSTGTQANDDQDKIDKNTDFKTCMKPVSQVEQIFLEELENLKRQEKEANDAARKEPTHKNQNAHTNNTNLLNTVSTPLSVVGPSRTFNDGEPLYPDDPSMPHLEDIYASPSKGIFTDSSYDDEGMVTEFNNLETTVNVSPTPTTRIHTIHPKTQIVGDPMSAVQTRSKVNKNSKAHALFQIQKVWILVYLPFRKKAIGTKWVYRNKKDKRGVVVRNKARLVSQGHRKKEGIDYDEIFAPVARIEAIRIFLAFASYMGFIVYQMDMKSDFMYGTIDEEAYVTQPPSFVDPKFPNKKSGYKRGAIDKTLFINQEKKDIILVQVYVNDIIFGSTKKSWCDEFEELMKNRFQMSSMGELTFFLRLQVKQKEVDCITPIETQKPLVKDEEAADVNVYLSRFQVTPKTSHLQAVKRIFRYLKGQPKLGNPQQEVVNFLAGYLFHSNAKSRLLWLLLLQRDAYEKKLIHMLKIHTDDNVADLLTKALMIAEDVIRQALRLDDADGVEGLSNEEIFTGLARMGYEKPPPKLTFYKTFFSAQWKFLIHILVQCISAKRTAWNEFSCSMASAVICLATDDLSSYNNQYTSSALTQKVFANMRRVGKGFSGVKTPLFATMIVQPQPQAAEEEDDVEGRIDDVSVAATKEVNAAEPTVFDDEEVTMTMAQTLIKMKAEKARLLDEQMAKRLHDEEVEQAAAKEKQEDDLEKAKVLQQQEYNKVQTLFKPDKDVEEPQKKRVAEETLIQESFKKLKAVEVSSSHSTQDTPSNDPRKISKEDVKNILEIVPVSEFMVEALQVKVGGITEAYQSFEEMLKGFDREDLDALWKLVKEKFSTAVPTVDKNKALWVELTRLFEPNADDVSGLIPSIPKSTAFFCNVPNAIKASILNSMHFAKGFCLDIARSGYSLDDSVNKLIFNGVWRWALDWISRFPIMAQLQVPLLLDDIDDVI